MWSLGIAKDLFSAFDPDDFFDAQVAGRYRYRYPGPRRHRHAADLVADFLGRPYTFDAYALAAARWARPQDPDLRRSGGALPPNCGAEVPD